MSTSQLCRSAILVFALAANISAQSKPRARDLGVPFDGTPGPNNAITDVTGVEVGHTTLISGEGKLVVGKGPVRTGVTAILPRGKASNDPVFAGMVLAERQRRDDRHHVGRGVRLPRTARCMITNTHSVGVVRDAVIAWRIKHGAPDVEGYWWSLPVVAETWDGDLNDINGFHVKPEARLPRARRRTRRAGGRRQRRRRHGHDLQRVQGRHRHRLAQARAKDGGYTVGVLVQCNYGPRAQLRIAGVPVGPRDPGHTPPAKDDVGSIIIVVATDAPLLPHQLKRLARRASLGLGAHRQLRPATAPATSSSRSRPRIPAPRPPERLHQLDDAARTTPSNRLFSRPCRPPKKPSSTPWSPPRP